jgi:arabinoxylan arabinofuranohydrolase
VLSIVTLENIDAVIYARGLRLQTTKTQMKYLLFLLAIVMAFPVSAFAASGGFLFTTFRDETTPMSEQIYMGVSDDGRNWEALNGGNPILVSDVGEKGVRDSFLLRSHNGRKFWLIGTDLCIARNSDWHRATHAGSRSIVVWESNDLVHWSPPRLAVVGADDAGCVWAPEAIYDQETGDYLVYWASTTAGDNYSKQRIWAAHTKDFRSFDKPFMYDEKPNHVIDIDIAQDGDAYYRFTKDDKLKSVTMESSKDLMGPWQEMPQFTAGQGKNFEGPICFLLEAAKAGGLPVWCLLLDNVSDRIGAGAAGYMPFVTNDLSTGLFTPATDFHFPYPFRHGSVLAVTAGELKRLKSAYNDQR